MKLLLICLSWAVIQLASAQSAAQSAMQLTQKHAKLDQQMLTRAEQYYKAEDYKAAQNELNRLKDIFPNDEHILLLEAQILMDNKKYKKSLQMLEDVILINPKNEVAYYYRGLVKDLDGKTVESIVEFTQAIQINPSYSLPYEARGTVKSKLGNHSSAIDDFSKAIELNPSLFLAYEGRGLAYYHASNYVLAVQDFDVVLKNNKKRSLSIYYRGLSRIKSGDRKGCKDLQQAMGLGISQAAVDMRQLCQ